VLGWLPSMLAGMGYTAEQAGLMHGIMQISGAVPALALIPAVKRIRVHGQLAMAVSFTAAIGFVGLMLNPSFATFWVALLGGGIGAAMVLGLSFLGLRTVTPHSAAALSGMAQCVGYGLAAMGPPLMGALRDQFQTWNIPLIVCAILCVTMGSLGLLAGRSVVIAGKPRDAVLAAS
jgi:CP family cyanate transporter-like MFS transporter